ncbi:MAG: hypothetical protein VX899_11080 [Myxococcota bacterium]|nr:hypothetical protein [Myxococcota bacterium]
MSPLRPSVRAFIALSCGLAVAGLALQVAWLSDDALITLRHLQQLAGGNGPVFNIGERVQGYTHPLWFGVLAACQALGAAPWRSAMVLGLVFSGVAVAGWAGMLLQKGEGSAQSLVLAGVTTLLLGTSESWLAFSTSGLENSLSHALLIGVAWELSQRGFQRPFVLSLLWALLGLNRMDMAAAALPSALLLARELKTPKRWLQAALGGLPMLAWLAFATLYYGDPLPNTARAKVGIFPSTADAIAQGWVYLQDWVVHEPGVALLSLAGVGLGLWRLRGQPTWALPLGALMHLVYVVVVGGDFMRGRFWLVLVVLGLSSLGLGLLELWRAHPRSQGWTGVFLGLSCLSPLLPQAPPGDPHEIPESGIVDERAYYYEFQSWSAIRRHGLRPQVVSQQIIDDMAAYISACGPMTVHAKMPGGIAYYSPLELSVVDPLGLTDRDVAALGAEYLIPERVRVGHPVKVVPVSLLAAKGDVSFLHGWLGAVGARDCALLEMPAAYLDSDALWYPPQTTFPMPATQ